MPVSVYLKSLMICNDKQVFFIVTEVIGANKRGVGWLFEGMRMQ